MMTHVAGVHHFWMTELLPITFHVIEEKRYFSTTSKRINKLIQDLISESDVVIENFRPGQLERLIGPIPTDVILCSITGFGQNGP